MTAKTYVIVDMISRLVAQTIQDRAQDFTDAFHQVDNASIHFNVFYVKSSDEYLLIDVTAVNVEREFRRAHMMSMSLNLQDARPDRHLVYINDTLLNMVNTMFHETMSDTSVERHITSCVNPHVFEITFYRNSHNEIIVVLRDGDSLNEITRFDVRIPTYSHFYKYTPSEDNVKEDDNTNNIAFTEVVLSEDDIRPL